jgi:hypothetical protein
VLLRKALCLCQPALSKAKELADAGHACKYRPSVTDRLPGRSAPITTEQYPVHSVCRPPPVRTEVAQPTDRSTDASLCHRVRAWRTCLQRFIHPKFQIRGIYHPLMVQQQASGSSLEIDVPRPVTNGIPGTATPGSRVGMLLPSPLRITHQPTRCSICLPTWPFKPGIRNLQAARRQVPQCRGKAQPVLAKRRCFDPLLSYRVPRRLASAGCRVAAQYNRRASRHPPVPPLARDFAAAASNLAPERVRGRRRSSRAAPTPDIIVVSWSIQQASSPAAER